MSKHAVFCIVKTQNQLVNIINQLRETGFSYDDISLLFPDKAGSKDLIHEKHTKAPEIAVQGASTGGVLGGTLGWLAGIGSLAIPGLGPFIAAGPILAALSGIAVGAALGGVTGALIGVGIPEYEAKQYEGKIKAGNILISVHTDDSDERERVKEIYKSADAEDIAVSKEVTVSSSH